MGGHPFYQLILGFLYRRGLGDRVGLLGHFRHHLPKHLTLLLLRILLGLLLHLRGGHPFLSLLAAAFLRSKLSIQISSVVLNSLAILTIRADVGVFEKRSKSEWIGNWLFEKHSTYSERFRKVFGECSRRIRCDIKPKEPFVLHWERIPGGC